MKGVREVITVKECIKMMCHRVYDDGAVAGRQRLVHLKDESEMRVKSGSSNLGFEKVEVASS